MGNESVLNAIEMAMANENVAIGWLRLKGEGVQTALGLDLAEWADSARAAAKFWRTVAGSEIADRIHPA